MEKFNDELMPVDDETEFEETLPEVVVSEDQVRDYLRSIGKHKLLSAEEEVALAQAIEVGLAAEDRLKTGDGELDFEDRRDLNTLVQEGRTAQQTMMTANLRLVVSQAKKYQVSGMTLLDLIQEGTFGLKRAVEKFDYTQGFKFSTYATGWIRQSIGRAIGEQKRLIRLPAHAHLDVSKLESARSRLLTKFEREPSDEALAAEMDVSMNELQTIQSFRQTVVSLNVRLGSDEDAELQEILVDPEALPVADTMDARKLHDDLHEALSLALSERELDIVYALYGVGKEAATPKEVGAVHGLSRYRIGDIKRQSLEKLRKNELVRQKLEDYYHDRAV